MKYLAIDYGGKRVGIAVSDIDGIFSFPRDTFINDDALFDNIKKICVDENVARVIVGMPLSFSGGESAQARKTKEFGERLKTYLALPTEYINEVLTTKMAERMAGTSKNSDQNAAAIILQSYLDKNKK